MSEQSQTTEAPDDTATVTVPLWALSFVMENADLADEGSYEFVYRSEGMKTAVAAIEEAINGKQ
jgi:hypothetical protein